MGSSCLPGGGLWEYILDFWDLKNCLVLWLDQNDVCFSADMPMPVLTPKYVCTGWCPWFRRPRWCRGKESACQHRSHGRHWSERCPGGGDGNPLQPVFLPGKCHGQRTWRAESMGSQRVRCDWAHTSLLYCPCSFSWRHSRPPQQSSH